MADATFKNAISGEFVNLVDFLPSSESRDLEAHVVEGELQFKPKRSKKSLDSFCVWLQALNEVSGDTRRCLHLWPRIREVRGNKYFDDLVAFFSAVC